MHMLCIIVYNPLAVPLVYFLYSRGCGRYGFGRHSPPCGRHGLILGPLSFVAVVDLAVIVCGRHGLAVIVLHVAVMDFFGAVIVCGRHGFGRHSLPCGRHGLWPSSSFPFQSPPLPSAEDGVGISTNPVSPATFGVLFAPSL